MPTERFIASVSPPDAPLTLEIERAKDGSVLDISFWRGSEAVASLPVASDFANEDVLAVGRGATDAAQIALAHKFLAAEDLFDALSHLLWRLSDDDHALRPFLGDEAVKRLRVHLGGAMLDAEAALAKARGESVEAAVEAASVAAPAATGRRESCQRCRGARTDKCLRCHGSGLEPVPPYAPAGEREATGHA